MGPFAAPTDVPVGVDIVAIEAELSRDGVAIENPQLVATQEPGLINVISHARSEGIENLKIVVLKADHFPDTSLRDLGTKVGEDIAGGHSVTVLVMSPHMVSTYSNQLSRYKLERGQDRLPLSNPSAAAQKFVNVTSTSNTNFTAITLVFLLVIALGAVGARIISRRFGQNAHPTRRVAK